jgi:hypothetical protein
MPKRAAVCVGVNRAGSMVALRAATAAARRFGSWAQGQGCDVTLLTDDEDDVILLDVHDAVNAFVQKTGVYEQIIVYFAGHGILPGPGNEKWLLSRAPENRNEAVDVALSIDDARNSGVSHVVFVSDACRSSASGPPLDNVDGGSVFPSGRYATTESEVDVFFATRPGDPAWEVPLDQAAGKYRTLFTDILLKTVAAPDASLVESRSDPPVSVITPRKLKPYLETNVPVEGAEADIRIRQTPLVRVGTALPKYFASIDAGDVRSPVRMRGPRRQAPVTLEAALDALAGEELGETTPSSIDDVAVRFGLRQDTAQLIAAGAAGRGVQGTAFVVLGADDLRATAMGWRSVPSRTDSGASQVQLERQGSRSGTSVLLEFYTSEGQRGTVMPAIEGFVGTVVVDAGGRVVSVQFEPSESSPR